MTCPLPQQDGLAAPSTNGNAACEAALRTIARRCRGDFRRHVRSAARGNADSLHEIRIALTRLRTAIRFFGPTVDKRDWKGLQNEARWLSRLAGKARDIDVALAHRKGAPHRSVRRWRRHRTRLYEKLRAALRSARYERLMEKLATQGRDAPSRVRGHDKAQELKDFSTSRLERWRQKLVKDRDKLGRMNPRKLHRLRMRAKRLKYALGWSQTMRGSEPGRFRKQMKQAQIVQNALGKLNDGATHRAQARILDLAPLPRMARLDRSSSRRILLRTAKDALKKLERLRPI